MSFFGFPRFIGLVNPDNLINFDAYKEKNGFEKR